jgi:hypothetical protein
MGLDVIFQVFQHDQAQYHPDTIQRHSGALFSRIWAIYCYGTPPSKLGRVFDRSLILAHRAPLLMVEMSRKATGCPPCWAGIIA